VWQVKEGNEERFVAAWKDLAEWTVANVPGSSWSQLFPDLGDQRRFVSLGPWESMEAIEAWRSLPAFKQLVTSMREMLE
jgi:heme-degrading monooxygenase HmoA